MLVDDLQFSNETSHNHIHDDGRLWFAEARFDNGYILVIRHIRRHYTPEIKLYEVDIYQKHRMDMIHRDNPIYKLSNLSCIDSRKLQLILDVVGSWINPNKLYTWKDEFYPLPLYFNKVMNEKNKI